jgi:hypothetical protein
MQFFIVSPLSKAAKSKHCRVPSQLWAAYRISITSSESTRTFVLIEHCSYFVASCSCVSYRVGKRTRLQLNTFLRKHHTLFLFVYLFLVILGFEISALISNRALGSCSIWATLKLFLLYFWDGVSHLYSGRPGLQPYLWSRSSWDDRGMPLYQLL